MASGFEDAVRLAIDRGLLAAADVVRGDLVVSATAHRNSTLRLIRQQAPSYLIKSPFESISRPAPEPASGEPLASPDIAEARFYRFCTSDPRATPVASLMPPLAATFERDSVLALQLVENARSLWSEYRKHPATALPLEVPRSLGTALGTLHRLFRDPRLRADLPFDERDATPPSTFSLHRPHPATRQDLSPARLELARCIQQEPTIGEGLEAARAAWRFDTVIHGDIRSENLLVVADVGTENQRILLIDWEFVQIGDPAWDLAAAFEDHARFWLASMSQQPDLEPSQRVATAAYPLETLYPAFADLWSGYQQAAGLNQSIDSGSSGDSDALLRRAVIFSGARLIQTAWEHCRHLERLSSLAVLLVQVGAHLLAEPESAAAELYHLGVDH